MSATMNFRSAGEISDKRVLGELANSIIALLQDATREVEKDREAAKTFIAKASSLLQFQIDRNGAPEVTARSGGLAGWKVRRLKAYIQEHLAGSVSVAELSEVAGLSTTHFSRAFGRSFGEAPHVYVVGRRLDRARHLMLTTDMPLSELALACGFSDQAHFSKLFRRHTGRTPAAWRRERRDAMRGTGLPAMPRAGSASTPVPTATMMQ
jgi:AraC family transcriptional regulator